MINGYDSIIRVWAATDVGKVREENEDCVGAGDQILQSSSGRFDLRFSIGDEAIAVVVADGVGGSRGGKVASGLAVSGFLSRCIYGADVPSLVSVLGEISERIRLACAQDSATRGGSTTLAGLVFTRSGGIAFNVGDSRIYLLIENELITLSRDHVSTADPRMLTKFLGGSGSAAMPHVHQFNFEKSVRFLICSDGLYSVLPHAALVQMTSLLNGEVAVNSLMDAALTAGAPDNVSLAVCDYLYASHT
ncbi:MAG: protein phosphatase 2C domain-containing protein [Rhodospirillales bacterium]|nr:protein phosphatase 2C domain-containing protein [Rhodospirillales bacterium]